MPNYALLTSAGKDRPGIVSAITKVLLDNNCNIEDSQMSRLGPDFACMLMIRMPEGTLGKQLRDALTDVTRKLELWLDIKDLQPEEVLETQTVKPKHLIHVYGADHKGIVFKITEHLTRNSVNITNLHTEVIHHQKPLYVMMIEVEIPNHVDSGQLQDELVKIGKEIEVVVSMKPKDDARF
ncbi:MAG: glycine cleavage system transcriptional repressor [Planctomycetota bacterium]|jgi:glycine cleavage system transcriptional repressor